MARAKLDQARVSDAGGAPSDCWRARPPRSAGSRTARGTGDSRPRPGSRRSAGSSAHASRPVTGTDAITSPRWDPRRARRALAPGTATLPWWTAARTRHSRSARPGRCVAGSRQSRPDGAGTARRGLELGLCAGGTENEPVTSSVSAAIGVVSRAWSVLFLIDVSAGRCASIDLTVLPSAGHSQMHTVTNR